MLKRAGISLSRRKRIELLSIFVFYLIAAVAVIWLNLGYLESALLYMGIPSLYLSLRNSQLIAKTALFSLLVTPTLGLVIDFLAHFNQAWYEVPSFLQIRFLHTFPLQAMLWGFLYSYFILVFYEYFLDRDRNKTRLSGNFRYWVVILLALLSVFSVILLLDCSLLTIRYFYIHLVIVLFFLPIVLVLSRFPRLIGKLAFQGVYFAVISVIYEISALYTGQWMFPGSEYLGWASLFGALIPIEEVLWILFAVPGYLCLYEYFADDTK